MDAQWCKSGQSSACTCERAHCCLVRGNAGQPLCCIIGTPSTCCVGRSPFCSAGAAPLCNAARRSTKLCCQSTRLAAELLVRANPHSLAQYRCRVTIRMVRPAAVLVAMVDSVADMGVVDTLEARLDDARKRHADGEYGTIPLTIAELGIRAQWATEHPSRPASPRLVRNEGGVDDEVNGGARVSGNNGTKQRGVIKVDGGVDRGQARVEVAGLKGFADGTVPIPLDEDVELRGEFCAAHLLTFMVISRCCSPVVQLALRSCRERLDAGHQACHFTLSTYQVKDDLYIGQLEEKMTHIWMASRSRRRTIAIMLDGSWLRCGWRAPNTHVLKSLPCSYNLMKRMMMVPDTRESLDEDSLTSYILQGEAMQEAQQPTELLPQASYTAQTKQNCQQEQRWKLGRGGSGGDSESSCSMIGVVEPTVSLAPEAGEDFQAVAAAVQANPMTVLLDSGWSHHRMGTKAVFVDMAPGDGVKHVCGFNGALQPIEGRETVALQGEAEKRVLIPDVLYVPGVQANLLSAGQLKESGVQLKGDDDEKLLVARPRADAPCVSCVGGKMAWHTFPTKGSDVEEALAVMHIDLCGPFRVAAKDGSLYFLLLKDRYTRFVWVMPIAKQSDVLREFQKWLVLVERQAKKSMLMLRSDRGGEFLGREFTDFVDGKGIVHDLTCPYTLQQNDMAEREMRRAVESVRTMLLHMAVDDAAGDDSVPAADREEARPHAGAGVGLHGAVHVPEQYRGGKLALKARWRLQQGVSPESKGWEVLDLTSNKVVTLVEVIFYETLSLEVWKAKYWPASGRTQAHPPTDTSTATVPLLAEVDNSFDEDVVEFLPPSPVLAPPLPVADRPASTPVSATSDEGSLEASPVALASGITPVEGSNQLVDDVDVDEEGKLSAGGESTDSDVVEVPIEKLELRCTGRTRKPPEQLVFHACLPPVAFTTVYDNIDDDLLYDDSEDDVDLPELNHDVHADPKHRWDIATMTVKEVLASWKGEVVKAAMDEEIRSLISMGTWELVERPWARHEVTFFQSKLDQVLYMYQLDYFDDGTGRVCKMLKSLYGLKQSPLLWYRALVIVLLGTGWRKSQVDTALYFKAGDSGVTC
ncbi:unnamed protein product [Closterium sp. NIES-54]